MTLLTKTSKKYLVFTVLVFLIAVFSVFKFYSASTSGDQLSPRATRSAQNSGDKPIQQSTATEPAAQNNSEVNNTAEKQSFAEEHETEATLKFKNWSEVTGFPKQESAGFYLGMPLDKISSLSNSGDLEAKYWYGLRLARAGDETGAKDILIDAVSDGSIGAAALLGDIYSGAAQRAFEIDKAAAYAWYRVAEAMGRHPNPMGSIRFSDPLEQQLAERLYVEYLSLVQKNYLDRYGTSIPYTPQP